jgi:hypothetical protein
MSVFSQQNAFLRDLYFETMAGYPESNRTTVYQTFSQERRLYQRNDHKDDSSLLHPLWIQGVQDGKIFGGTPDATINTTSPVEFTTPPRLITYN